MKYILNLTLVFTPEQRSLALINNNEAEIILSAPASRLLAHLIMHVDVILSRDDLLKNVWEDYGYASSNSNLNSYISEIRKAFRELSCNSQMIVTVPKVGLKLVANIDVFCLQEDDTILVTDSAKHQESLSVEAVKSVSDKNNKPHKFTQLYQLKWFFLFLSILCIGFLSWNRNEININRTYPIFLDAFEKCNIYALESYYGYSKDNAVSKTIIEIDKRKVNCRFSESNIYVDYRHNEKNESTYSFFGVCSLGGNNKYVCKTYSSGD